jgi:hypothetical protein
MAKKATIKKRAPARVSSVEQFIASADDALGMSNPFDHNEPRTQKIDGKTKAYKTIGLQFNRYEWWELEQAVKKSKRSVNSIIREGIQKELNSID